MRAGRTFTYSHSSHNDYKKNHAYQAPTGTSVHHTSNILWYYIEKAINESSASFLAPH